MILKTYRNLWGVVGPKDAAIAAIQDGGYYGIEAVLFTKTEHATVRSVLRRRRMPFKGVVLIRGADPTVAGQVSSVVSEMHALARTGADSLNVIGGYDCWSTDEAARYFEAVMKAGDALGIPVSHETHRNSALFHPAAARRMLSLFPELRLTCDFSHWVVACERLIDDQLDLIRLCGSRAAHIHTRVGTEQAPQVGDVRAPESLPYLKAFERWWAIVWEEQAARGMAVTTACPEFGPPPYTPTLPHTGKPVSDLGAVCDWQRKRQETHFKSWAASQKTRARTHR